MALGGVIRDVGGGSARRRDLPPRDGPIPPSSRWSLRCWWAAVGAILLIPPQTGATIPDHEPILNQGRDDRTGPPH